MNPEDEQKVHRKVFKFTYMYINKKKLIKDEFFLWVAYFLYFVENLLLLKAISNTEKIYV